MGSYERVAVFTREASVCEINSPVGAACFDWARLARVAPIVRDGVVCWTDRLRANETGVTRAV